MNPDLEQFKLPQLNLEDFKTTSPTVSSENIGGVTVGNPYQGFFEQNPSGPSPFVTDEFATSPIIPYGPQSRGIITTAGLGVVNAPTSLLRVAEFLVNPKNSFNFGRALAGGVQSIPGIKQFFDTASPAKGREILATNREMFHNLVDTLRNQFGSIENIKRSIAEDPFGTGLIVRGLMEGASGLTKKAGFKTTAGVIEKVATTPERVAGKIIEKAKGVPETPEEIAGRVSGAKPREIPKVVNTLEQVDLSGVKTYAEAAKRIQDEGITPNLGLVDEKLGKSTQQLKTDALTKEISVQGKVIKTDYVTKALDQLEELYDKTTAPDDLARIIDLKSKYQESGLTPLEINNIAREYGTDFGQKAFSKVSGEPLTSVNAQDFENIRVGVKETARDLMPDENTRVLDKNVTDMIRTKQLMEKRDIAAQQVANRIVKAGLGQKLAHAFGLTLDTISGHAIGSLLRGLKGYKATKTLNALELQDRLPKEISAFQKLSKMKPEQAEAILENPTVKIPVQNLTPFQKIINMTKPKKLEVQNLTPDEIEILRTIRYPENPKGEGAATPKTVFQKQIQSTTFQGFKDLTSKFLDYAAGKTFLSKQEIMNFARRPELKKGEADLLTRLGSEVKETKIPAQEFADSIRRDLLKLKPIKVKNPQYARITINPYENSETGRTIFEDKPLSGKNYEEVVFESPIITNGSTHYPNSKNYFAHARGDEVIEGGKKIWREQEIQSDLLQKENLARSVLKTRDISYDALRKKGYSEQQILERFGGGDIQKLQPFTNDHFGERIMRERIKQKAQQGYSNYRIPTGETIGKIEGFRDLRRWYSAQEPARGSLSTLGEELTPQSLKTGQEIVDNFGREHWIITDILGNGRFKAVPKNRIMTDAMIKNSGEIESKKIINNQNYLLRDTETFDLTGKSNPQYLRYEKWGKWLRNKFGGKEVTDPQDNTWIEIELKPEYKKMPVEAFGLSETKSFV